MSNTPPLPAPVDPQAAGLLSLARHLRDEAEGTRVRHNIRTAYVALSIDDVVKLVDGLEAYHAKAVAELRLLLTDTAIFPQLEPANRVSAYLRNTQVHNAARALGLTL